MAVPEPSPASTGGRTSPPAMGKVAARGMAWTTLAVLLGRLTGFLGQLVLGWLLSKDDFGTYAVAISLSVLVLTIRTSGLQKLLIQRGAEFDGLAQPVARLSLLANLLGMVLLMVLAPIGSAYYEIRELVPLISIIALSLPLSVPAEIIRAKMAVDLKFRDLAIVNAVSMVTSQAMVVALAWCGMGAYSFVIPLASVALLESIVLLVWLGWWPAGRKLDRELVAELLRAMKWILPCGFAGAIIVQGTHLVVGKLEPLAVTGLFFFGFQLTTSLAVFFNAGMQRVLMPVMSRFGEQPERQGQAYLKSVRLLVAAASPLCLLGVLVAKPMMHLLWQGRWDDASPVVLLLGTALPIYLMTGVGAAALESQGRWRENTLLHFASAIGTLVTAWIGASQGGLIAIALCAAVFRLCFGVLHGMIVAAMMGQSRRRFLITIFSPFIVSCISAAIVYLLWTQLLGGQAMHWIEAIGMGAIYAALVTYAYRRWLRSTMEELQPASWLKRRKSFSG